MSLAKLYVEVGSNISGFRSGMKEVNTTVDKAASKANFMSNAFSTALGVGIAGAVGKAVSSLTNLVSNVVSTGISFNTLQENSLTAFETMLQSGTKAQEFLKQLKQFAIKTPFELPGLIDSSQRLLAFGFTAKSVIPTLTSIGDAVAGLGGSPEKLNRVITAIGQIRAKGKAQAEELLQLTEVGIPAWDMLAKKIGVGIPEAMKMVTRGTVTADTAISAILEGMDSKFGGLMEKQAKGWSGMISNIRDTFTQVSGRVLKPFFELGKKGMSLLLRVFESQGFETFISILERGTQRTANFIERIGKGFISLFSGQGIGNFISQFTGLTKLLSKYENKRFGFLSNFTPKEAITAIQGFINDLKNGGKNIDYWISHTPRLLQPLEKITLKAMEVWKWLAGEGVRNTLKKLGSILIWLGQTLAKLVKPFREALGSLFQQLSTMKSMGFSDVFSAIIQALISAFAGVIKVIKENFWPGIKSAFVWVWDSLKTWFLSISWSDLWNTIVAGFTGLVNFVKGIDWKGIWDLIVTGFTGLINFVKGIDWNSIWKTVLGALSVIGDFFKESILPTLSSFFSWLVSWITDPSKSSMLWNAITTSWDFITSWAKSLWDWISPSLGSFFGYLFSWFTDPEKRSKLIQALSATWNFLTEWASKLWDWISPGLGSFFGSLSSWFTDPTKRSKLWQGVVATWNFLTQWATSLWNWVSPPLGSFFQYLFSWVTDSTKRNQLYQGLVSGWNFITLWAGKLWEWASPKLAEFYNNLITWLNNQRPGLGTALDEWRKQFVSFITQVRDSFQQQWPTISQATMEAAKSISKDIGDMLWAIKQLFTFTSSDGAKTVSEWVKLFTSIYVVVSRVGAGVVRIISSMVQAMASLKQAIDSFGSGNFSGVMDALNSLNNSIANFQGTVIEDIAKWIDPLYWLGLRPEDIQQSGNGFAEGGTVRSSGVKLVGERGPELLNLKAGDTVTNNKDTQSLLRGTASRLDLYIHNESKFPIDRETVKEIAIMLQRELNLKGARSIFVN